MGKSNKNQHFVPQYYLKNFALNKILHIYDLKEKRQFKNSISSVAFKKFFYNVDVDFFNEILENEIIVNEDFIDKIINDFNEKILAVFFDSFNYTKERIINNDRRVTISIIDFYSLVDFILVQSYRNPKFTLFFKSIDDKIKHKKSSDKKYDKIFRGIVLLLLFNELYYGKKTNFKKDFLQEPFDILINEIKVFKILISESCKIVYFNRTKTDFLTCDFPMALTRINKTDFFSTIFVPINPKVGFFLINKKSETYNHFVENEGKIIDLDDKDLKKVNELNLSILNNSNRFVFSFDGNFPLEIDKIEYKYWWDID